ncbi:hypothetical protein WMY93_010923 [Mugilogobius chulae]|uniref:Tectonic domain-containing protein n=1 Tax=Mugilogobius chulae TaxID=88201 RepID=A0AAW0PHR3_9GOBI
MHRRSRNQCDHRGVTSIPTENDTSLPTPATTVLSKVTDGPTVLPLDAQGCLCDLTPDFCDIGCCCDTLDCDVANLSTVFTACPQKAIPGICIEKWLMFHANVDSSLVTITDSLFCVQTAEKLVSTIEDSPNYPALGHSYHFAPPKQITTTFTRDFYRVDDLILTYFPKTSARGILRQPSPGVASALCTNRNPAKFMRSSAFSCSREVTLESCTTDPTLNAQFYISDLNLIKHPILETDPVTDLLIPVITLSNWTVPTIQNNSCVDVVQGVEFIIGYSEKGELLSAKVYILIRQISTASSEQAPAVGLKPGSPVIGRYYDDVKALTVIGPSQNGACSDPNTRKPVRFGHNSISGCTFTSIVKNCSDLRTKIYDIHRRVTIPELVAMNSGTEPDWTRVIIEECSLSSQESCDTGCLLPHTLFIRVLWAQQGLLELPQKYILGVNTHSDVVSLSVLSLPPSLCPMK